jgi:hypothetical protein
MHPPIDHAEVTRRIIAAKRLMAPSRDALRRAFAEVGAALAREVDEAVAAQANGRSVVPEIAHAAIADGQVPSQTIAEIRRRGVVVIRGVYPRRQAEEWNDELGEYIIANNYDTSPRAPVHDRYFANLTAARPQIFGIYWSRPQVMARQHPAMAEARRFLNRLWKFEDGGIQHFDPDRECTYADRVRRREPGDESFGLSPHMDAGSVERWIDPAYARVYASVFAGNWRVHDPFDAAGRAEVREIPSPAVCSMFRTFQGWTALTPQGPGDGTLMVIPILSAVVYMLLRALQDDVPEDSLCGAEPGCALSALPEWHGLLLPAVQSISPVEPGDAVFWHPDVVHAVEETHRGRTMSNVIYIGAAPFCAKNAGFLPRQAEAFLAGRSSPDFAAEDHEIDYVGRATLDDLTALGRRQMGLEAW